MDNNNNHLNNHPDGAMRQVLPGLAVGSLGMLIYQDRAAADTLAFQLCAQVAGGPLLLRQGIPAVAQAEAIYLTEHTSPEKVLDDFELPLALHCTPEQRSSMATRMGVAQTDDPHWTDKEWLRFIRGIAKTHRLMIMEMPSRCYDKIRLFRESLALYSGLRAIAAETGCAIVIMCPECFHGDNSLMLWNLFEIAHWKAFLMPLLGSEPRSAADLGGSQYQLVINKPHVSSPPICLGLRKPPGSRLSRTLLLHHME